MIFGHDLPERMSFNTQKSQNYLLNDVSEQTRVLNRLV